MIAKVTAFRPSVPSWRRPAEEVPINDLYGLMLKHLDLAAGDRFDGKPEAKKLQAREAAETIRAALERK